MKALNLAWLLVGILVGAGALFVACRKTPEKPETLQAFTADSYAAYLDAVAAFEIPTEPGPVPEVDDYLKTFTLVRAAKEPTRIEGDPDSWTGTVAAYALENDPTPSVWIVKTTLTGELEGFKVLSDTDNPL